MQGTWQIQEAKNKLSEVVEEAIEHGPQILTRRGVEVAVVLSFSEYVQLKKKQIPLSEFFQRSPLAEIELDRDRSPVRPSPDFDLSS
jgi:antitoxin Phd